MVRGEAGCAANSAVTRAKQRLIVSNGGQSDMVALEPDLKLSTNSTAILQIRCCELLTRYSQLHLSGHGAVQIREFGSFNI